MMSPLLLGSAGPGPADRLFSDCCRELYASALNRQLQRNAWLSIAKLFEAGSVSLRTQVEGPGELVEGSRTLVFDQRTDQPSLAHALVEAEADHGLCSFIRRGDAGSDVLLVLRKMIPFTEGERRWMELLTPHVRTAIALAQQMGVAPSARPMIVPSCAPLTKAELEVLASLLQGQTAKAIARNRGASLNTVRSQITAILGKTGRHTQKELIAAFSNM